MSFGENSRTEILLSQCTYAESYSLRYGDVERIDTGREMSAFLGC